MELKLSSPKIWLYQQAVDFRKSIDGLSVLASKACRDNLHSAIFIFYNRAQDKVKLLAWHGNGFMLLYKRLERGHFCFSDTCDGLVSIEEKQLSWLLAGLPWVQMSAWNSLSYDDYY